MALKIFVTGPRHGQRGWLNVYAPDKSAKGMKQGVMNSQWVLAIVDAQYFERNFCLLELRWAGQFKKPVQVVISVED